MGDLDSYPYTPFIEHWDGIRWTRQDVAGAPVGTYFFSVDAASASDVWAAGVTRDDTGSSSALAHFDGTAWTYTPAAPPRHDDEWLSDVTVVGPSDVWVVGSQGGAVEPDTVLTEHWNGRRWAVVDAPGRSKSRDALYGVTALGSDDLLAVGAYEVHDKSRALAERWDGSAWHLVP